VENTRHPKARLLLSIGLAAIMLSGCGDEGQEATESPVGVVWSVDSFYEGQETIDELIWGTEITLTLGEDGQLNGSGGCNNYSGSYEIDGDAITIGPLVTTRMACQEPAGVMEQESAYLTALASAASYSTDRDNMEFTDSDGTTVVTYVTGANSTD
jgi:heat shock protein HslJ